MGVGVFSFERESRKHLTNERCLFRRVARASKLFKILEPLPKMISTPNNTIVIINAAGIVVSLLLLLLLAGTAKSHDLIMT